MAACQAKLRTSALEKLRDRRQRPQLADWSRSYPSLFPSPRSPNPKASRAGRGLNTLASTLPQATGTPELADTGDALKLDDTEDAVVG
jgi:hypothetical protein